ncbi:hypothetical protein DFJ77DRAFT_29164 [Powellomyces hirtus]|nr:hypothetical protein DFJ77DRAFT_29164 [Powellomyces hirtus]
MASSLVNLLLSPGLAMLIRRRNSPNTLDMHMRRTCPPAVFRGSDTKKPHPSKHVNMCCMGCFERANSCEEK